MFLTYPLAILEYMIQKRQQPLHKNERAVLLSIMHTKYIQATGKTIS